MSFLPFVSTWMYGGSTARQSANYFVSFGLMSDLPEPGEVPVGIGLAIKFMWAALKRRKTDERRNL